MNRMQTRILSLLICAVMLLGMIPFGVAAEDTFFTFADGVLTITDDMPSYDDPSQVPWDSYRDQITKIVIQGEFVWYIGDHAFANCTNLKSIVIDCDMINSIGEGTFRGCTSLTDIDFGTELGTIQTYAFADCTALKRVDLPANIRYVGYGAFQGCTGLQDVYFYTRKVQFPEACIDEENCIYSNAETIPETAMIHGYASFPAEYYCERNNRPFTLIDEGVAMEAVNNNSTYDIGFNNDYLVNLWAASDGTQSIDFDYDVTIDADQLALIHDGMVDGYGEAISEGSNTSGQARVEVQIAFLNENAGYSESLYWYGNYRYEQYDITGKVNEEYKNWVTSGSAPFVTFTANGRDLTVHIDGTLADIQKYIEETFEQEYKLEEMYIMIRCQGISHYRSSSGYEYENKRTFIEGMSVGLADVHKYNVDCEMRETTTMDMPYVVTCSVPEENAGYLEPVSKNFTWSYSITRYGEYIPELDRMLGEMPDIDWENPDGTFLEEYEGVTYGTVAGTFDAGNNPSATIRQMLKPDQIDFVESLAGLQSYGESGQQLQMQLNCTVTFIYADGTKSTTIPVADERTCFADFCVHACSVCGLCTADNMLPCNSDRYGESRILECSCETSAPALSVNRVEDAVITESNLYAGDPRIIVEQVQVTDPNANRYTKKLFKNLNPNKTYAVFDISVLDGDRPYIPNQWGGNYEYAIITIPVSEAVMNQILSGDVAIYHIAADGTAEPVSITPDPENLTITFKGTHFSPYVLADTVSYYGRNALMAMENGEKYAYAYDMILFYLNDNTYDEEVTIWVNDLDERFTSEELAMVIDVFRRDHPELFWIADEYRFVGEEGDIGYFYLTMELMNEDRSNAVNAVEDAAAQILSGITEDMSDYEKELYIHDALASHITYEVTDNAHNIYGALTEGKAVCDGYAEAFQYLLREAGIQSYIAVGTGNGGAHAWNYVRIDGEYYQVDLTWDDQGDELYHAYFNVTDTMIQEDHTSNTEAYSLPVCDSQEAFYFYGKPENLETYTVDSVSDVFADQGMKAHVYIPGDVTAFVTWLQSNIGQIAARVGVTDSFSYSYSLLGHELILKINSGKVVAVVNADTVIQYRTVQEAVNACPNGAHLQLLEDVEENISLNQDLYIDLCGNDLTGTITTNGYRIYGMDSTTNKYTCLTMGYFSCTDENGTAIIPQTLYTTADMMRYMTIATENGYTFHRFYLGITKLSLVPAATGFGYKAEFYGDNMVQSQIASIGYKLWLTEDLVVCRSAAFKNNLTLRLKNIDAAKFGETPINASVTITLLDGTVIESATASYTLRQVVEAVNESYREFDDAQLAAVRDMIAGNAAMQGWLVENLYIQKDA